MVGQYVFEVHGGSDSGGGGGVGSGNGSDDFSNYDFELDI